MSEEIKEVPSLTLEPFAEEAPVAPAAAETSPAQPPEEAVLDESNLTEEEREMVAEFAEKIELSNSNMVIQYGAGAQKKIADFSETALSNVRTKDLGEIGDMISGVVTELKSFDVEENEKGFFSFFKRTSNKITALKAKYDKAEANVDKISHALEGHQIQLLKDVAMLDKMYELNKVYFKELSMYILAGKKFTSSTTTTT